MSVEGSGGDRLVYWSEDDLMRRLRRIEGQVRGVQAMVQRRESCRALLTQIAAVEGALGQVSHIVKACSIAEGISHHQSLDHEAVRQALNELLK